MVRATDTRAIVLGAAGVSDGIHILNLSVVPATTVDTHSLGSAPVDVVLTPDGTKAVVRAGASGEAITVYDLVTGARTTTIGSNSGVFGLSDAVMATNTRAVVLGGAGATVSVHILDLQVIPAATVATHSLGSAPRHLAITPDGSKAVVRAGGSGEAITVYDLASGAMTASIASNSAPFYFGDCVVASNTRAVTLGAAGATDSVHVLDLTTSPPSTLATHSLASAPGDLDITPDGSKAVVRAGGSGDGITVYDLATGALLAQFSSNSAPFPCRDAVALTDTRALVLGAAGATDSVRLLDLTTNPPTSLVVHTLSSRPEHLAITPNGLHGVVRAGGSGDAISVYDLTTGARTATFGSNGAPYNLHESVAATNPRAVVLGAAGATDSVHVLDLGTPAATGQSILSRYGEIVHAVGDPVPAAAAGVTPAPGASIWAINHFDFPSIDQNGAILYRARMTGGGSSAVDDRAYFLGRASGDLRMVVRAGDQAPGLPPGILMRTATSSTALSAAPRISPFGEILFFHSTLYDLPGAGAATPANADTALFWGPVGGVTALCREGDPVPPTLSNTGETWGPFLTSSPLQLTMVNAAGAVLFGGQLLGGASTTANDGFLVAGAPGALTFVLREGEDFSGAIAMPALGPTQMSVTMQLNEAGQVLHGINFSTTLGTAPAVAGNDRALAVWTPGGGQTAIIAREGDQAPGLAPGVIFANGWTVNASNACFTRSGKTAITSPLSGPGITTDVNDYAIHFGGQGGWTLVMQKGDPCPGLGAGESFGTVTNLSLTCNDAGQVAFLGSLVGGSVTAANDSSMWVGSAGNLQMIAREGDPVPGFPGYAYGPINTSPLLNDRGQVAFPSSITNGTAKTVLLGYTPTLGIVNLLDAGDEFTTGLGTDTWSVLAGSVGFNGGDGGQSMFNNSGDFVYRLNLGAPLTAAVLRGHLGSLVAEPSSVPVTGGVPHEFHVDFAASQAGRFYFLLATSFGTRPGFSGSIFGWPHTVPLNPDPLWTTLSLNNPNSSVWVNSLGYLDANGDGIGAASFVMPAGFPGFVGTTLHHAAFAVDITNGITVTEVSEPSAVKLY
jgi:hypothetical protein